MNTSPHRISSFSMLLVAALAVAQVQAQTPAPNPPNAPGKTGVVGGIGYSALVAGQMLLPTQYIQSPNKKFNLRFRKDGQLSVLSGGEFIWLNGALSTTPQYIEMGTDGSVRCNQSAGVPTYWMVRIWAPGAFLAIQDDGNVVLYDPTMRPLWARDGSVAPFVEVLKPTQAPPPAPQPPVIQTSGTAYGIAYNAVTDYAYLPGQYTPSPNGKYRLIFQADGKLVIHDGAKPLWSTGAVAYPPIEARWINGMLGIWVDKGGGWRVKTDIIDTLAKGGRVLAMQDDGHLVVYPAGGTTREWVSP